MYLFTDMYKKVEARIGCVLLRDHATLSCNFFYIHVSVCITIPVLNQMKRAVHKQTAPAEGGHCHSFGPDERGSGGSMHAAAAAVAARCALLVHAWLAK